MKIIGSSIALLLVLGLIVGVGYGVITGYEFLAVQWGALSGNWKAILIVVAALAMFCALFVSISIQSSVKKYGLKGTGKVMAYNDFIHWYSTVKSNNTDAMQADVIKPVVNQMQLWGSNQVARQAGLLFEHLQADGTDRDTVLKKAGHVYIEIRRDLGLRGIIGENAVR